MTLASTMAPQKTKIAKNQVWRKWKISSIARFMFIKSEIRAFPLLLRTGEGMRVSFSWEKTTRRVEASLYPYRENAQVWHGEGCLVANVSPGRAEGAVIFVGDERVRRGRL